MNLTLLGDRFLRDGEGWLDLATGDRVSIETRSAPTTGEQVVWAEACAILAALRHPLLNPLLDFGVADRTTLFEAYARLPAVRLPCGAARRLVAHAERFLEAHGVALLSHMRRQLFRTLRITRNRCPRAVGIVLQPRPVLETLRELIAEAPVPGTVAVTVAGASGSGMRTLRLAVARIARVAGYVPVCAAALARAPAVAPLVLDRHVCVLAHAEASRDRGTLAALLAELARRSTRSHRCVTFSAIQAGAHGGVLPLEAMGVKTMVSMIYRDTESGPSARELLEAACRAEGNPGVFLAALGAGEEPRSPGRGVTVHEAPAPYEVSVPVAGAPPVRPVGRLASVLSRAPARAEALEARGRHGAAARLLGRAGRVLEGRGSRGAAAGCWLQLAWLERNRGALGRAHEHADRARLVDASPETHLAAGLLTAACWTDGGRFVEAEAALRTLRAAAAALPDERLGPRATLALARVLCWDGRAHEALAVLEPLIGSPDPAVVCEATASSSRAHLRAAELTRAIGAASDALTRASRLAVGRLRASAHRVMAEALLAAGDPDGARSHITAGIDAAREARLPLAVLRLRALLLRAAADADAPEARRLRGSLERALRRELPAVIRRTIEAACRSPRAAYGQEAREGQAAAVEVFLDIAQRAADDRTAVLDVLAALCERLGAVSAVIAAPEGRTVAAAGRPWRAGSTVLIQALAGGTAACADVLQPLECAEPVRCGGELVGALGCRWAAGAAPLPRLRAATLRSAAMALATHLRALLDTTGPEPPTAVCGDLLGDSALAAALREAVHRASRAPFNVLIEGESGVGKELVARAIHRLGPRHARRFCAINCAALTDELVEAELFGHTRGAFTGAMAERAGLFEEADGGTLFLDEVGELSPRAQAKLLRVLQEGEVRRLGENLPRRVDVRIVAATNRSLEREAAGGRFRIDLRFRLDVLRIVVPPLRDRCGDIPVLARHFWAQAAERVGSRATLGPDALAALSRYDWPGNVRELQNAIAWMAVHAPRRGRVDARMLPARLAASTPATGTFEAAREEFERRYLRAALAQAGGQRQKAARALGISRQGLAKMLRRLGIEQNGAT